MMKICKANIELEAVSENESFARVAASAFIARLDPTLEEMSDVKTAISEAVTNSIIHAYDCEGGVIRMEMEIRDNEFSISIIDYGKGIGDVKKAMEPMYTTCGERERSGMGFVFMEAFMDELEVESVVGKGTIVHMKKKIGNVSLQTMGGTSGNADV